MKLRTISALTLAASTMFAASSAMAWESEDGQHSTSASVGLYSDYIFRGISFTDEDPAIQGSFDYAHASGLYAGTWASNLSDSSDSNIEIDLYVGFASEFGDTGIGYDFTVLRYMYPGQNSNDELDYTEYLGALSYSYFTAMVGYTSELSGDSDIDETYYNLSFDYELPYGIGFNAAVGYTDSDRNDGTSLSDSYVDYTLGLSKSFIGLDWSVAYVGTNGDGEDFELQNGTSDDRLVFGVSSSF
jgi:uncharacterized protein (TIGR02001 family)